jgi:molybdate transport system permease protein
MLHQWISPQDASALWLTLKLAAVSTVVLLILGHATWRGGWRARGRVSSW